MLCASLGGRGVLGRMDTRICMAESLRYSPETIINIVNCCTPIQNVFGVKKKTKIKFLKNPKKKKASKIICIHNNI